VVRRCTKRYCIALSKACLFPNVSSTGLTSRVFRIACGMSEQKTGVASKHLTFELAEKSATGKAAMGALAIFVPARRLLRSALGLMRLTQPPPLQRARSCIISRL
jgi:hypothetical protein